MSENEQEKRETLADIVAEILAYGAQPPPRLMWLEIADRIEAAWKRQMSQSWHHREMEELVARHESEVAELKKRSGNAAALREALSDACYAMFNFIKTQSGGYEEMANALDKAKSALAAPARNCDVARDWLKDLYVHFKPPCKREMPPEWVDAVMAFCMWIVAPAEKGGAE